MTARIASIALLVALALSCAGAPVDPLDKQTSQHFETKSGLFAIDTGSRRVRYIVEYAVVSPFDQPVSLVAEFENPVSPDEPLVVERQLAPDESEFEIQSPVLPGIQNGGVYRVKLVARDAAGSEVARHIQHLRFLMPPGL